MVGGVRLLRSRPRTAPAKEQPLLRLSPVNTHCQSRLSFNQTDLTIGSHQATPTTQTNIHMASAALMMPVAPMPTAPMATDNIQDLLKRKREAESNKRRFHLTEVDANLLLTNANEFSFEDGQVIGKAGDSLNAAYRVKSGTVVLMKDGKKFCEVNQVCIFTSSCTYIHENITILFYHHKIPPTLPFPDWRQSIEHPFAHAHTWQSLVVSQHLTYFSFLTGILYWRSSFPQFTIR